MGSVCSWSLVTKEKGTALGKETKHPLPRKVIYFPHDYELQPLDPQKGSQHQEDGVAVLGGREQVAVGECGCWGGGLGTPHVPITRVPIARVSTTPFPWSPPSLMAKCGGCRALPCGASAPTSPASSTSTP